jgi:hypothetical protein
VTQLQKKLLLACPFERLLALAVQKGKLEEVFSFPSAIMIKRPEVDHPIRYVTEFKC